MDAAPNGQPQTATAVSASIDTKSKPKRVIKRTPEQLAKKRVQDREAQRISRERTKTLIAEQELQLKELREENERHGRQCEVLLRERDAALDEAHQLRGKLDITEKRLQDLSRRLATVLELLRPGLRDQHGFLPVDHENGQPIMNHTGCFLDSNSPGYYQQEQNYPEKPITTGNSQHFAQLSPRSIRTDKSFRQVSVDAPSPCALQCLSPSASSLSSEQCHAKTNSATAGTPPTGIILPPLKGPARRPSASYLGEVLQPYVLSATSSDDRYLLPAWNIRTKISQSTCPLDDILQGLVTSRRAVFEQTGSELSAAGPAQPSMSALLNLGESSPIHHISQIMSNAITKFESVHQLPERAAALFVMYQTLRWQICPTKENYYRLPEWLRPLPCQNSIAHPIWMDYVPWPKMRNIICQDHLKYDQNEFFLPYVQTLSLNWPYEPMDCVVVQSDMINSSISPIFERHVRNLDNWSLGDSFKTAYPSLVGTYRLKNQ